MEINMKIKKEISELIKSADEVIKIHNDDFFKSEYESWYALSKKYLKKFLNESLKCKVKFPLNLG